MKDSFIRILIVVMALFSWVNMAHAEDASHTVYVIQKGDTLTAIAARFDTSVEKLVNINRIDNRDKIDTGWAILVRQTKVPVYIVRKGDTLSKIAMRFDTSVSKIVAQNEIENPNCIKVDQVFRLEQNAFTTTSKVKVISRVQKSSAANIAQKDILVNITPARSQTKIPRDLEQVATSTPPTNVSGVNEMVTTPQKGFVQKNTSPLDSTPPTDRDEKEQFLASPLGPTPGNVNQAMENPDKHRKSGLIVLVRYLNNCSAETHCDPQEAKGELYMKRE